MDLTRTIVKGLTNPTNAYFVAVQAIIALTLAWIAFVVTGVLLLWGVPTPIITFFQFPAGAWIWFAGAGVLFSVYGIFLALVLYRAATRNAEPPNSTFSGR